MNARVRRRSRGIPIDERREVEDEEQSAVVMTHRADGTSEMLTIAEAIEGYDAGEIESIEWIDDYAERRRRQPIDETDDEREAREHRETLGSAANPHPGSSAQPHKPLAESEVTMVCGYCRRANRVRMHHTITQLEDA